MNLSGPQTQHSPVMGSESSSYQPLSLGSISIDDGGSTELDDETFVSEIDGSDGSSSSVTDQRVHHVDESPPEAPVKEMLPAKMGPNSNSKEFAADRLKLRTICDSVDESGSSEDDEDDEDIHPYSRTLSRTSSKFEFPEEERLYDVDSRDVGTADSWVKRHPEMLRLTGRHPFNSEAPLHKLMGKGFLTPTNLHYVRNHGYVPQGVWDDWRVEICGRVKMPTKLSMIDLVTKFPQRELPVTLVCAGNRRMEQNMTAKTIGFNWGAAGVSTSVWRGVLLCDVLKSCGVMSKRNGAHFVCFEGAETLPAGGGTRYGTSILIDTAMDKKCDILVAFQQNGKPLDPDHGYPVRMIIPGHIGGRMVKWLTKIEVTPKESFNYYHFNDNRVLPSHVDAEMAKAEGWWYKPDYIINELNVNSAISSPGHNEELAFESMQQFYNVKGYAYSGGGRKIIRVELSLDLGSTWRLCNVTYTEKPTKYGKYWCWVFWELDVDITEFLQSKELAVRAWDASMNSQPERLTWNVMGMMNNCWFRIKVCPCRTIHGSVGLNFQHPTFPGKELGGWMHTAKAAKDAAMPERGMQKSVSTPSLASKAERQIPMGEVRRHTDSECAWIVVHGVVYDCTAFLKDHPGGADSILLTAGTDATEEFDAIHSEKAKVMLEKYRIGVLSADDNDSTSSVPTPDSSLHGGNNSVHLATILEAAEADAAHPISLNPKERINLPLVEKEVLSEDVRKLRFALQSKDHILGLPVGKHVLIAAKISGRLVMRAYTPTSCDKELGYVDLLVKVYQKSTNYPVGGLMSQHLDSLKIGDTIGFKGPLGHIHYQGQGRLTVDKELKSVRRFAMIAGGTGITPMYQIIRAVLEDPEDTTEIFLLYSNRAEGDIMAKGQIDRWRDGHSNFKVWYTLSGKVAEDWPYGRGRITEQMMREHLPVGNSVDTYACLCGPPTLENACLPLLERLGYDKKECFRF